MDVPFALWMSVFAGVGVIAAVVAAGVWRASGRPGLVIAIAAWLGIDVLLGMAGVFEASANRRVPLIALGVVVPIVAGIWVLRRTNVADALTPRWLVAVQAYRVVGVLFLVAWAQGRIPAEFALPA